MKWRKLNRAVHRDLGYMFFAMTIIYSISGIVMNHNKPGGDASIVTRSESFDVDVVSRESFDLTYIYEILEKKEIAESEYKSYFFLSDEKVMIYLKNGHIELNLPFGEAKLVSIKKRPVLYEFNFLHYNKPKKLWTWFSDIFAGALIVMAISGLIMVRGKNGFKKRGAILTGIGIFIPLLFLVFYLWAT